MNQFVYVKENVFNHKKRTARVLFLWRYSPMAKIPALAAYKQA